MQLGICAGRCGHVETVCGTLIATWNFIGCFVTISRLNETVLTLLCQENGQCKNVFNGFWMDRVTRYCHNHCCFRLHLFMVICWQHVCTQFKCIHSRSLSLSLLGLSNLGQGSQCRLAKESCRLVPFLSLLSLCLTIAEYICRVDIRISLTCLNAHCYNVAWYWTLHCAVKVVPKVINWE